jgi:hypothetical protein
MPPTAAESVIATGARSRARCMRKMQSATTICESRRQSPARARCDEHALDDALGVAVERAHVVGNDSLAVPVAHVQIAGHSNRYEGAAPPSRS